MAKMSQLKLAALSLDLFGQPFNFKVSRYFHTHKTYTGFFFTLIMIPFLIAYGAYKWTVLTGHSDSNILTTVHRLYFDDDFTISSETHNFKVAFAFVNYDDPSEMELAGIEEADYGEMKAFYKSWGDPNNPGVNFIPLASRPCTPSELLLEEDDNETEDKF